MKSMVKQLFPGLAFSLCALCAFVVNLRADDWPQWRGPKRDGVSAEKGLLQQWPKDGPKLAWSVSTLGVGYSGPAIVGDRVFIAGSKGTDELLFALDAKTGQELWSVKIGPLYTLKAINPWGGGPRATPAVDGEFVYALGGFGDLVCVDAVKKAVVWSKNMTKDLGGVVNPITGGAPGWGYSWSPLVDGDVVVCAPGGKQGLLAALDKKKKGDVVWQSKDAPDSCTYSSPLAAEIGGVRQYVSMTQTGVVGIDAKTGGLLWRYTRKPEYKDVVITTPLVSKDTVYTTTGMGFRAGSDLVQVTAGAKGLEAKKVWANDVLPNTQGGVVLIDGHVYGFSESKETPGWVCQKVEDGEAVWNSEELGVGSVVAADGHLYCLDEDEGVVALVEASPKAWKEKGRFPLPEQGKKAPNGKVWTHPVIANGKLYLRDQEWLFCYEVK